MKKICDNREIMAVATYNRVWVVRFDVVGAITDVYRVHVAYMNCPSNPYTPAAYCDRREFIQWVMSPEYRINNWSIFKNKIWKWRHRI